MAGHLLADEKRHATNAFARSVDGDFLFTTQVAHPKACRWCLYGALIACARVLGVDLNLGDIWRHLPAGWSDYTVWDEASPTQRLEMARKLRES
jgi:hypothetical protein